MSTRGKLQAFVNSIFNQQHIIIYIFHRQKYLGRALTALESLTAITSNKSMNLGILDINDDNYYMTLDSY